jgi:predicted nucleic acid-binding protein
MASLTHYDGNSGTLVDTNVWIDCMNASSPWHNWALDQVQTCFDAGVLHVNVVVYTELLVPEPDVAMLDAMLDIYEVQRSHLPWTCAALAAKAYSSYRLRGGAKTKPMPDFYIGAHAAVANLTLLTRDAGTYASYFPRLKRVSAVN